MTHFRASREQQRAKSLDELHVDIEGALLEHGVGARAQEQRAQKSATRCVDIDRFDGECVDDLLRRRARPPRRVEEILTFRQHLAKKALVEMTEQRVLIWVAPVERAHHYTGALHDLGERRFAESLFLQDLLGRIENAIERFLASALLGRLEELRM